MSEEEPRSASGSGAAPALLVDHLTKRFGDRTAVEDVSFEVGRGDVFAFLGPNGAGKTTTVRMLGTVIEPSSGSAAIGRPSPLSCRRGAGRGATTKNMTTWLPAVLIGLVLGYGTTFLRETGLVIAALVTLGLAAVYVLQGRHRDVGLLLVAEGLYPMMVAGWALWDAATRSDIEVGPDMTLIFGGGLLAIGVGVVLTLMACVRPAAP